MFVDGAPELDLGDLGCIFQSQALSIGSCPLPRLLVPPGRTNVRPRVVPSLIMVKLTPDLVYGAAQYTNPCKERQLDLRGEGEDIVLLLLF